MLGDCPANLGSSLGGGEPGGACPAGEQSCGFLCLCPFCRAAAPRAWKPKLFLQQLLFCLAQGQLVGSPQLRFPVAVSQVGRPRCCLGWWSTVSAELTLACSKGGGIVLKPGSLNSPESSPQGLSLLLGRVERTGPVLPSLLSSRGVLGQIFLWLSGSLGLSLFPPLTSCLSRLLPVRTLQLTLDLASHTQDAPC